MIKVFICSAVTLHVFKNTVNYADMALLNVFVYWALMEAEELYREWRRKHGHRKKSKKAA